jgi:CRISPR-associated endonuclease Cas1
MAANPANAILNYLYALLEAECRIACLAIGLDPGLGIVHADQRSRDSLALDIMEAVRPDVDAYVLDLLASRVFAARDFHETRQGAVGCCLR